MSILVVCLSVAKFFKMILYLVNPLFNNNLLGKGEVKIQKEINVSDKNSPNPFLQDFCFMNQNIFNSVLSPVFDKTHLPYLPILPRGSKTLVQQS